MDRAEVGVVRAGLAARAAHTHPDGAQQPGDGPADRPRPPDQHGASGDAVTGARTPLAQLVGELGGGRGSAQVTGADIGLGQDRGDRVRDVPGRGGMAEVFEHHGRGPDRAQRVGDALARDVGRGAVHRLEHRGEVPLGGAVGRRRDADGSGDRGREVAEGVAEEVGGDDDVEAGWFEDELGRERVDVLLVPGDLREGGGPLGDELVQDAGAQSPGDCPPGIRDHREPGPGQYQGHERHAVLGLGGDGELDARFAQRVDVGAHPGTPLLDDQPLSRKLPALHRRPISERAVGRHHQHETLPPQRMGDDLLVGDRTGGRRKPQLHGTRAHHVDHICLQTPHGLPGRLDQGPSGPIARIDHLEENLAAERLPGGRRASVAWRVQSER